MTIWILLILNIKSSNLFVNSFSTKSKCEQRIKEMAKIYIFQCVETKLDI